MSRDISRTMVDDVIFFSPASPEHQKREKSKARELKLSQWWKNQLGRGVCHYCEQKFRPQELTLDHILPIARGGESSKKNCVPCCKECNTKKGNKTLTELALAKIKAATSVDGSD